MREAIEEVACRRILRRKVSKFTQWDKSMEEIWAGLKEVTGTVMYKQRDRSMICWRKPVSGKYKLNFDGAAQGNPGEAGFGAIVRNCQGKCVAAAHGYICTATNNKAELIRLRRGLILCRDKDFSNVDIEGDSQLVINAISKGQIANWKLKQWIPGIQNLINLLLDYAIAHNYRKGNRAADWLANEGVQA
ncbi:uncharacterized protein LOC131033335 [Cryptomeria japonica]|uniref:uncharacterized protein LOC131033335 n=1 Tax=Cryptomeria japonica TaxID=3369 RepID=UPI0027DA0560|nr:uncharacterized protein LOC131033335 [Cryptomeria japonica]